MSLALSSAQADLLRRAADRIDAAWRQRFLDAVTDQLVALGVVRTDDVVSAIRTSARMMGATPMSAWAISMHQWIDDMRASVPDDLHPQARVVIGEWLGDMHVAADAGDTDALARLARLIADRIVQERVWQVESMAAVEDAGRRVA